MNEKIEQSEVSHSAVFPPRSRVISELSGMSSSAEEGVTSKATLMARNQRTHQDKSAKTYFFKAYPEGSHLTGLEAYCASICQLIATAQYVPNTHPYYTETNIPVGVASKAIKGFRPHNERPLESCNLLIHDQAIHAEFIKRSAELSTRNLLEHYSRYSGMGQQLKYFFTFDSSAHFANKNALRNMLVEYISNPEHHSAEVILEALTKRKKSLKPDVVGNHSELASEYHLLDQTISELSVLNTIRPYRSDSELSVELMERIYLKVLSQEINLAECSGSLKVEIAHTEYEATAQDLNNYRIIRGLATCLTTRYIFEEGDANNTNFSKFGEFIDFGWTKAGLLFECRNRSVGDYLFRHPDERSFACSEDNMLYFPHLQDSGLFYWPTLQPDIQGLFLLRMNEILSVCEQKILESDNPLLTKLIAGLFTLFENDHSQNIAFANVLKESAHGLFLTFTAYMTSQSPSVLMAKEKIRNLFVELRDYVGRLAATLKPELFNLGTIGAGLDLLYSYIDSISLFLQQLKIPGQLNDVIDNLPYGSDFLNNIEMTLERNSDFFEQLTSALTLLKSDLQCKFEQYMHNSFSSQDNIHFKLLAGHPVFIVHKYKTLLKYILTDESFYRVFAALNIPNEAGCSSSESHESMHDLLVNDELLRIQEIRSTLIAMPDFRLFIRQYGNFAFALIQDEFKSLREKYNNKGIQRVYYEPLIDALDPELMITKFLQLCSECKNAEEGNSGEVNMEHSARCSSN